MMNDGPLVARLRIVPHAARYVLAIRREGRIEFLITGPTRASAYALARRLAAKHGRPGLQLILERSGGGQGS